MPDCILIEETETIFNRSACNAGRFFYSDLFTHYFKLPVAGCQLPVAGNQVVLIFCPVTGNR
jgi:hypothetical protein